MSQIGRGSLNFKLAIRKMNFSDWIFPLENAMKGKNKRSNLFIYFPKFYRTLNFLSFWSLFGGCCGMIPRLLGIDFRSVRCIFEAGRPTEISVPGMEISVGLSAFPSASGT